MNCCFLVLCDDCDSPSSTDKNLCLASNRLCETSNKRGQPKFWRRTFYLCGLWQHASWKICVRMPPLRFVIHCHRFSSCSAYCSVPLVCRILFVVFLVDPHRWGPVFSSDPSTINNANATLKFCQMSIITTEYRDPGQDPTVHHMKTFVSRHYPSVNIDEEWGQPNDLPVNSQRYVPRSTINSELDLVFETKTWNFMKISNKVGSVAEFLSSSPSFWRYDVYHIHVV